MSITRDCGIEPVEYARLQTQWFRYADGLPWGPGHRDDSSYRAALRAASLHVAPDAAMEHVCNLIEQNGGAWDPDKLRSQFDRAANHVGKSRTSVLTSYYRKRPRPRPAFEPDSLHAFVATFPTDSPEDFIRRRSPICPDHVTSDDFLGHIYRPGERVILFSDHQSQGQSVWERDIYPGPFNSVPTGGSDGVWYLVNPVDGEYHPNPRQHGRLSRRSEEAVTSFRFAVLESDAAPADVWLRFLALLPLPIAAIYSSGGRSIHALLQLNAATKTEWDQYVKPVKRALTRFGADPGCLSAVRLSRLPQAWRGDVQQRLIYLAPNCSGTSIVKMPERTALEDAIQYVELHLATGRSMHLEKLQSCRSSLEAHPGDVRAAELLASISRRYRGGSQ